MEPESPRNSEQEALQQVTALMSAAGLSPPPKEVERLAGLYPGLRKVADRFHQIDVGDEVTAAVFAADLDGTVAARSKGSGS